MSWISNVNFLQKAEGQPNGAPLREMAEDRFSDLRTENMARSMSMQPLIMSASAEWESFENRW